MSSAAYQPIPSDDNHSTSHPPPAKIQRRTSKFCRLVVITVALCLVAIATYKAVQRLASTSALSESISQQEPPAEQYGDIAVDPIPIQAENTDSDESKPSDMPGNGKYSVG